MFFDADEFWEALFQEARHPDTETIVISSYGLYAGISDTGENTSARYGYKSPQQDILNLSNIGKKVIFLLSESEPTECCPNCAHCKAKNAKRDARTAAHINHWPNVSWHVTTECHMKAALLKRKNGTVLGYSGGRNFSSSGWDDVSFKLSDEDAKTLLIRVIDNIKKKSINPNGGQNA